MHSAFFNPTAASSPSSSFAVRWGTTPDMTVEQAGFFFSALVVSTKDNRDHLQTRTHMYYFCSAPLSNFFLLNLAHFRFRHRKKMILCEKNMPNRTKCIHSWCAHFLFFKEKKIYSSFFRSTTVVQCVSVRVPFYAPQLSPSCVVKIKEEGEEKEYVCIQKRAGTHARRKKEKIFRSTYPT